MRILIYVDPVIYRHDAMALAPHSNFARTFINANWRPDTEYAFATSPWLIEEYDLLCDLHGGHKEIRRYPLNPAHILAPFDFDTISYSLDQFDTSYSNTNLIGALKSMRDDFDPHVVICSTQTEYPQHIFKAALIVWHDLSHILRKDGSYNLYLDVCGHQYDSVLNIGKQYILEYEPDQKTVDAILDRHNLEVFQTPRALAQRKTFIDWRRENGLSETKLALVALQPDHMITFEGAYGGRSSERVLMRTLAELPSGWKAVASYHPKDRTLSQLEPYIGRSFDNLVLLPPHILGDRSDYLVPEFNGIVTVSSKVGLLGLLAGCRVISLGRSAYYDWCAHEVADLETVTPLQTRDIAKLIQFMSNRYYFTFEEWFQRNHFMLETFEAINLATSPLDYQLDISEWSIQSLDRLFGS